MQNQKMSIIKQHILLLIIVVSLTTACDNSLLVPTPTIEPIPFSSKDLSILKGEPCEAPCWYNIIPNLSTKSELLSVLNDLDFLDATTIRTRTTHYWDPTTGYSIKDGELVAVDCKNPEGHQCVGAIVVDEQVKMIGVYLNYDLKSREIIDRIGPPDYIRRTWERGINPECDIMLLWMDKQIIAETRFVNDNDDIICSSDQIDTLTIGEQIIFKITYTIPETFINVPLEDIDYHWDEFIKD